VKGATPGPVAAAIAIFYIFLWASAYVPSKIAAVETAPLWFLAARFLVAGLILALLALALRKPGPGNLRGWCVAGALGIFTNALYLGLTYMAMQRLSAGMATLVASTNPLVLGLLAPRFLAEALTRWKALGLILGFGGVAFVIVARHGTPSAAPFDAALAFCGVLSSVVSTLLFKRFAIDQSLVAINAIQLCAAGLVTIPVAFLLYGAPRFVLTAELTASYLYLVVVISVGASLIWFWLLRHGEASRVTAYYYLTPIFGLALAATLLHEPLALSDLVGLVAIAIGIALVQRS
jgi:drug/metabolite transporter (DMT)-like permease